MITLVRHGETVWSREKKHTSTTDLPLTEEGRREALLLKEPLSRESFDQVFTSPLKRASETAAIAGFKEIESLDLLIEWCYGDYEGLTSQEIWKRDPLWNIFTSGAPGGESTQEMAARMEKLAHFLSELKGKTLLFSSGHILRALAAIWIKQPISVGRSLSLSTASISKLGREHDFPAILLWNLNLKG